MTLNYELKDDQVQIEIDPKIFPKPVVLRTAYKFIDRAWMTIEKPEDLDSVLVTVMPRDSESRNDEYMKDLALRFNTDLITSFVEDKEAERYAEARNSMVKAAMLSQTQKK